MSALDPNTYHRVRFTRHGRVIEAALHRPDALNAIDETMHEELARLFGDLARDEASDVVILTGSGAAFSAGGDLAWMRAVARGEARGPGIDDARRIVHGLIDLEKPIIAKLRGPCIGLGATIALLCDAVFADPTARIADPHVRAGIVAGDGGAVVWPLILGPMLAKRHLMSGDPLSAEDAHRLGLVSDLVPPERLEADTLAYAQRLAAGALMAIRYTKVAANTHLRHWTTMILEACLAHEMRTFDTEDHREAIAAFLEKRPPRFPGR